MKQIDVTQALLCCATDEPAEHYPCEGCYLSSLRDDGSQIDGTVCNKRLALDAINYIRRINNFEKSQCAIMLKKMERLETERDAAIALHKDCSAELIRMRKAFELSIKAHSANQLQIEHLMQHYIQKVQES